MRLARLAKLIHAISTITGYVGCLACSLMVVLCLGEIFSRTFFHKSLIITTEVMGWLMLSIVFLGIPWTMKVNGHIHIRLIVDRLPYNIQKWLPLAWITIGFCCLVPFCIWVLRGLWDYYEAGSIGFIFPLWWPWTVMFVGSVLFALELLACLLDAIEAARNSSEKRVSWN